MRGAREGAARRVRRMSYARPQPIGSAARASGCDGSMAEGSCSAKKRGQASRPWRRSASWRSAGGDRGSLLRRGGGLPDVISLGLRRGARGRTVAADGLLAARIEGCGSMPSGAFEPVLASGRRRGNGAGEGPARGRVRRLGVGEGRDEAGGRPARGPRGRSRPSCRRSRSVAKARSSAAGSAGPRSADGEAWTLLAAARLVPGSPGQALKRPRGLSLAGSATLHERRTFQKNPSSTSRSAFEELRPWHPAAQ